MDLDAIISAMEANEGHTKSAAAAPTTPSIDQSILNAALEKAAGAPSAPVAETDAVQALLKTANELAGTEKEAEISHAAICGQAFADGAIAKFASYDAQVAQAGVAPMAKHAENHDAELQAAAEYGYKLAHDKMAEDYNAGHNEALQQVHDVAANEFIKGASEVEVMVQLINQGAV